MNIIEEVESRLKKHFKHADISIDFSDGQHMYLEIHSEDFAGMNLLQQHRKVNLALEDLLKSDQLHALKLKTKAK